MLTVFVVSDATGATADQLVRAALVQFRDAEVSLARRSQVRTPEQVRAVIGEAAAAQSLVVHTLVSHDLRRLILEESRRQGVDAMDILGPVLDRLAAHLKLTPDQKPGLFQQLDQQKQREIEAVDFAFHHDDGQNVDEIGRAEVVLVGISRSMKTPTMLYLAYRGWFAANVPLVPEIPPPPSLLALPPQRIFCLLMAPSRLLELRRARAEQSAIPLVPYASPDQINRELFYAEEMCRRYRWQKLDVTGKSVEEVSREILLLLPASDRRERWGERELES
ncbi:MAG: kinase/pyrophosphorylase [Pirellulales bacterium]|nr:kinase/pyrophosphorylase [Pirellulales bacterium]